MGRALWLLFCVLLIFGTLHCSKDHSLPPKFHESRIGHPSRLGSILCRGRCNPGMEHERHCDRLLLYSHGN